MSLDTRTNVLNGLAPKYAEIFGKKYSNLYKEHIGKSLQDFWKNYADLASNSW